MEKHNKQNKKIPLIIILGPTSVGKTALSLLLAKKFNGEIVSADSRQVYKRLDIGTGKATKRERRAITHHLIDWKEPGRTITLAEYKHAADRAIHDIHARKKIPFLVGGSPLYIQAVVENYLIPEVKPQRKLRKALESCDGETLVTLARTVDPVSAYRIEHKNKRRLIRAIEVTLACGTPFSALQKKGDPHYHCLLIGLSLPRQDLYVRINKRVEQRMKKGMLREIERLVSSGVSEAWLNTLGLEYRHLSLFLKNQSRTDRTTLAKAIQALQYAIHDFARRQMVWFRHDKRIRWIAPSNHALASRLIRDFLF